MSPREVDPWSCGGCNIGEHDSCSGIIRRVVEGRMADVRCRCDDRGHRPLPRVVEEEVRFQ